MAGICTRCDGCGQIADTDEGEPWTQWANLPVQSATAVLMGIVKPIPCPSCGGAGVALNADALPDLYRACRAVKLLIAPLLTASDDFDTVFVAISDALNKARDERG